MVCCSYVGICFGVEHHHMPDHELHLAWRTKDFKNWSQDHGRTWAVRGAHIRKGFEGKMGMYMGIGASSRCEFASDRKMITRASSLVRMKT